MHTSGLLGKVYNKIIVKRFANQKTIQIELGGMWWGGMSRQHGSVMLDTSPITLY